VSGVVALAIAVVLAAPGDVAQRFDRATDLVGAQKHAEAAKELEALAEEFPSSDLAPEALFLAATLSEEHLDRPAHAAALYRQIGERHSDSRVAIAARRRLETLAPMLGDKPEAMTEFVSIKRRLPELGSLRALAEAEQLLARFSDWSGAHQVRLWMAGVAQRSGSPARAARLYDAVLESSVDGDVRFEAGLRAATLAVERGAYDRAEELLGNLPESTNPGREAARLDALGSLDRARTRAGVNSFALVLLFAGPLLLIASLRHGAGSWGAAARQIARPPTEAIYLAPLAAIFAVVALTGHHEVARAVITIAVAGVLVAWLSGVGLRASAPTRWRPIAHAFTAGITVIAACYVAVHAGDLVDLIISTVRLGPDV